MNSILIKFSVLILFFGCSSNPTVADRTVIQKLNGASYESTNNMGIVTELPLLRKITGQLYCGDSLSQTPTKLAEVRITQAGKTIGTTTSNVAGQYLLLAKVSKQTNMT